MRDNGLLAVPVNMNLVLRPVFTDVSTRRIWTRPYLSGIGFRYDIHCPRLG